MSPAELQEVQKQLKDYLEKGFIQPSNSPYGSPIPFVRKKTGELRMGVDYRALNDQTIKDRYPLPRIEEILDRLRGASHYTKFDLTTLATINLAWRLKTCPRQPSGPATASMSSRSCHLASATRRLPSNEP